MKLTRIAVKHPITTIMVFLAVVLLGFVSLSRVGLELFPDITYPTAAVVVVHPGVGPYEIESAISKRVEEAVSSISGVERVASTSSEGVSMVVVNFSWGTNMDTIVSDIREKIDAIANDLPEGAYRPEIFRFNPEMLPSMVLNCTSSNPRVDMRKLIEDNIVPDLEKIEGVATAEIFGGKIAAVTCKLSLDDLIRSETSILQILHMFQGENINLPGGTLELPSEHIVLRTIGEFKSIADIGDMLVGYREQIPIYLGDVAEIALDYLPQEEIVRAQGQSGIQISIRKQPGFNTVKVNDRVKLTLKRLGEQYPSLKFTIQTDQSTSILNSIGGVADAGWQGGLLAILVLMFFLRNIRSTFIISLAIPLSVVATFSLMDMAGISMNMLSLMGITLGIGMFVDNSIVVLEASYRKKLTGLDSGQAAVEGAGEVGMAIIASTLTTIAVFFPLVFVEGLVGMIFKDLAFTISFALLISLASALTLIPVMFTKLLKGKKIPVLSRKKGANPQPEHNPHATGTAGGFSGSELSLADIQVHTGNKIIDRLGAGIQKALRRLDRSYEKVISWALDHSPVIILSALILLAVSFGFIVFLGMEFIPEVDEAKFVVGLETKLGTPYAKTEAKVIQAENIIKRLLGDDVDTMSSNIGRGAAEVGMAESGSHMANIKVTLTSKDRRAQSIWKIVGRLSKELRENILDALIKIDISGMASLASSATGQKDPIVIEITGANLQESYAFAKELAVLVENVSGTRDVQISHKTGKPELQFRIKRRAAAGLGITPKEIAVTVRTAYKGMEVSQYNDGTHDYDIVVILKDEDRNNIKRLTNLFLVNRSGTKILAETVADLHQDEGPLSIERIQRQRIIMVTAALTGERALSNVVADIKQRVTERLPIPADIHVDYTGSGKQMDEAFGSLGWVLLLAVLLVYMVMASQFESLLHPFIVMFAVPFAVIGLVAALLVTNTTFNLVAFIGGILLVGIVVNNGIVLIDYMNTLQKRGVPLRQAIIRGGKTRLKPILMTTFTTVIGLLPMALGFGAGSEIRAPMGRAVLGGLLSSGLITLILIPTVYWLVESKLKKKKI
ncbi:MAG: efflux RND transporter permease subunit [Spirochaetales bacterium]|nr:efflux RND transporter permease subunit [Spirochaetales bacterium]